MASRHNATNTMVLMVSRGKNGHYPSCNDFNGLISDQEEYDRVDRDGCNMCSSIEEYYKEIKGENCGG